MSDAAPERLSTRHYLGYAAGEVSNNLTFSMISAFLLIYYTDVAGISAATAGTLFLVVRILGGITDLVAGNRVDETDTRWGRFRPYLLLGSAPLLLLLIAVFTIPEGLSDDAKIVWALVSYSLFQLAYSFVNIPYGSLSAAMTQEPDERARLSTGRVIAASSTILLIAVVVSPQIEGAGDLQASLTLITVIFAAVGFALYLWCFATAREVVERDAAAVGVRETLAMVRRNRPLILLCLSSVLFLTGLFSIQTVGVFYARDVLDDANLYIVMTVVQTVTMIAAAAVVPKAAEAVGKKRTYIAAGVIGTLAGTGLALSPGSAPAIAIGFWGLLGVALGAINTLIFALQADTVDYGEWKTGTRAEGGSYSLLSFSRKTGQAVGGSLAAFTIGIGGYVSGAASQTDAAVISIKVAAGAIPAAVILAATAVMLLYPLTETALRQMVGDMAARRVGREVGRPVDEAGAR